MLQSPSPFPDPQPQLTAGSLGDTSCEEDAELSPSVRLPSLSPHIPPMGQLVTALGAFSTYNLFKCVFLLSTGLSTPLLSVR